MLEIEVKCPVCNKKIESWIVTSPNVPDHKNFKCLYCRSTLKSNHDYALKKAIILGLVLYLLFTVVLNIFVFNKNSELIIAILGTTIPLVVSFFVYRLSLKIKLNVLRKD